MRLITCIRAVALTAALSAAGAAAAGPVEDGNAGLEAMKNGEYKRAVTLFTHALSSSKLSNDDKEFAYSQRGAAYLKDGNPVAAVADFKRALKLKPDDADAQSGLEEAQAGLADAGGRKSEGAGGGGAATSSGSASKAAQAAMEALNGGDYARAIQLFTRAIDSGKLSAEDRELALLSRGKAYMQKGEYSSAVLDLNRALHIKGDDQEAMEAFDKALSQVRAKVPVAGIDGPTCTKNFSAVGSILSGKTYTGFADYPTLSSFDAFAGVYTALRSYTPVPGMPWQFSETNLDGGSIKGGITFADSGRTITLEVHITAVDGGTRITIIESVPGLLPTIDLKGTVCHALSDAAKG